MDAFNDVVVPTNVEAGPWTISGRQRNHRRMVTVEADGVDLSHVLDFEHVLRCCWALNHSSLLSFPFHSQKETNNLAFYVF